MSGRLSEQMRNALVGLLRVGEGHRFSELERLRTAPTKASGRVLSVQLQRVSELAELGAGALVVEPVPEVKLAALARYGRAAKAPALADLGGDRKAATLLATVRHLKTASVDDALDVLDLLISTNLLARAERAGSCARSRSCARRRARWLRRWRC